LFTESERRLIELAVLRLPRYAWAKEFLEPRRRRFRRLDAFADRIYNATTALIGIFL